MGTNLLNSRDDYFCCSRSVILTYICLNKINEGQQHMPIYYYNIKMYYFIDFYSNFIFLMLMGRKFLNGSNIKFKLFLNI